MKNYSSSFEYIEKGVRQGGVLSPFLFKIYMNEILNDICNMDQGCIIGINRVNILAYADDIVLCAPSIESMNDIFTKFCCHISDVSLKINFDKTKCMMLGSNRQRESHKFK